MASNSFFYSSASTIHHYADHQFFILSHKRVKTNSHVRRLVQPQVLSVYLVEHNLVVLLLPGTSIDLQAMLDSLLFARVQVQE
jgi:hypothetical protein